MRRMSSTLETKISFIDLYFRGRRKMPLHRIYKCPLSHAGRMYLVRARDANAPSVSHLNESIDRLFNSYGIVKDDIAHLFAYDPQIVKDDTCFLVLEFLDQRAIELGDHKNDARDFHLQQPPYIF